MAFDPKGKGNGNANRLKDMSQSQLIAWIESLSLGFKGDIVSGIRSYAKDLEMEIDGSMFVLANLGDIKEMTGISTPKAITFMKKIAAKKESDFKPVRASLKDDKNDKIISFTLKIDCKKRYNIPGANKNWTISKCKYEFLRYIGSDGKAELYAAHASANWVSPSKGNGVQFKQMGKDLSDNVTLGSIGIINGMHLPLVTSFRVIGGGGPLEVNYLDWTPLYHKCMVCSAKRVNNLSWGYWHHPGGNKAYFVSSKPNKGYVVEMKGDKIRCDQCKTECKFNDWQFKCNNHDYQKIQ